MLLRCPRPTLLISVITFARLTESWDYPFEIPIRWQRIPRAASYRVNSVDWKVSLRLARNGCIGGKRDDKVSLELSFIRLYTGRNVRHSLLCVA